ncbi:hypothetical protein PO878_01580 [Iamia majanohamensis]|uniref:Uncharacterized protein n=1 Tax=Iamia majanohamensis TaxID=467976 RepID=A0AAE9YA32_9ACTN|nr:hypothetical protein [Iamia majanohamensis]WCO67408.1 hypothetical protein PO878_01580 [Iamia majanohamensis]
MAHDGDETTEHMIEGTRAAREAAEEAVEDVHEDADELEERLESEGLEPGADDEE